MLCCDGAAADVGENMSSNRVAEKLGSSANGSASLYCVKLERVAGASTIDGRVVSPLSISGRDAERMGSDDTGTECRRSAGSSKLPGTYRDAEDAGSACSGCCGDAGRAGAADSAVGEVARVGTRDRWKDLSFDRVR